MHRLEIDHLSRKPARQHANRRREIRLVIGMRTLAALGCLFALWASPGCFELTYPACRIRCNAGEACPRDLHCVASNRPSGDFFCAKTGQASCDDSPGAGNDAGPSADATDASVPDGDATTGPPQMICHRQSCLTLPEAIRSNLALLLWPSTLPPLGSPVPTWPDLSGHGNDARALNPGARPTVTEDGVKLETGQPGAGFIVANHPSLDLAADDFSILVVSGLDIVMPATLFINSDGNRVDPRQVVLSWVSLTDGMVRRPQARINATTVTAGVDIPPRSVNVYTLRRTGGHMELRVNGVVLGSADLADPTQSTSNAENVFLGVSSMNGQPVGSLQATFTIKSSLNSTDLAALEQFLQTTFQRSP